MSTSNASLVMTASSGITPSRFKVCLCISGLDLSQPASYTVVMTSRKSWTGLIASWKHKWAMVVMIAFFRFSSLVLLTAGATLEKKRVGSALLI